MRAFLSPLNFCRPFAVTTVVFATLFAVGCGNSTVATDNDAIDLNDIDTDITDLDGLDIDQDLLNGSDIVKTDTVGHDADASGTDAAGTDAAGTDASGTDATGTDASGTDATGTDASGTDAADTEIGSDAEDTTDAVDTVDVAAGCTEVADCGDGNPCTDDLCLIATGECTHNNNVKACDDSNGCTLNDVCGGGTCLPGAPSPCEDNNPCTTDSCDKTSGCVFAANTLPCDDSVSCTIGDTCLDLSCVGTPTNSACEDNNNCTTDTCTSGGCANVNNTSSCNDGDACTIEDACSDGSCMGAPKNCDDENQCTSDKCFEGTCQHKPLGEASCNDGNPCTVSDFCNGDGLCASGGAKNCNDGNACTADSCNPATVGGCVNADLGGEVTCTDGSVCTLGDHCGGGVCLSGTATTCDDSNICTTDSCDPTSGCVFLPNTVTCNDGDICTLPDTCTDTVCVGTPIVCDPVGYDWAQGEEYCKPMGYCDYADGQCKISTDYVWQGSFQPSTPWKTTGEWEIGLAKASTDAAGSDPASDVDGDGYLAGSVIGGNISNIPHDWYYLTSPAIDLSGFVTSTYLDGSNYDRSLLLYFAWWSTLQSDNGEHVKLEMTADGKTWELYGEPSNASTEGWSNSDVFVNSNPMIPKKYWTKQFHFRIGYNVTSIETAIPIVSGISVDNAYIVVGNCWD